MSCRHTGVKQRARLRCAILAVAVLGLGGCSGAIPEEAAKEDTEVAVQVGTVTKADLRARVEAYGMVEPEPAKPGQPGGGAKLAAPIAGMVTAVQVIEGQSVKAGDVVVELDDRMAQAAVDKAQHALVFAQQVVDRQTRVLAFGGTSMQAKQEAEQRSPPRARNLPRQRPPLPKCNSPRRWMASSHESMSSLDSRST
jgi:multidrug efflux pump subunit AcrA (membrane-fusion protein)